MKFDLQMEAFYGLENRKYSTKVPLVGNKISLSLSHYRIAAST
jgi:hypothetical protein